MWAKLKSWLWTSERDTCGPTLLLWSVGPLWRGWAASSTSVVNISEDLTWTTHIQTQVKKARQRLYHLRQLRKFRVSPTILKTFYSGTIESVLTQCISVWYGNSSSQDCKALQRVVRLDERISGSALPSLQDIYLKPNAAEAELSKSSRTQITPVTVFSLCCHLVSASAAWWQKLRDLGGVSSPRPSGS